MESELVDLDQSASRFVATIDLPQNVRSCVTDIEERGPRVVWMRTSPPELCFEATGPQASFLVDEIEPIVSVREEDDSDFDAPYTGPIEPVEL